MRGRAAMAMAVLVALALPAAAPAGGFATLGLSSLPDGTAPGRPWHVTLTILQHGRTPMADLRPTVRIRRAGGGAARAFAARPAGPLAGVLPAPGRRGRGGEPATVAAR